MIMFWFTQAFILLYAIYLTEAGYGTLSYSSSDSQSDVQAPSYVPPYIRNQQFIKTGPHSYQGIKTYTGTKTAYGGTKNVYSGTKNVYSQTGAPSRYSESRSWYSNSNVAPNYDVFSNNANQPFEPKCNPECKNSGICLDTNTCSCPANYHGQNCEFEKKPCLNYPPLPMNSRRKCSTEQCTITCMDGHKFIDGSTVANMRCVEGEWQPSRADFTIIPDCQPECDPPCLNGGVCLALNTCNCPSAFRGPQCQYSVSVCDVRKLAFNGGYKCAGDGEKFSCRLTCPAGSTYSAPPASLYTCQYATGMFQPQPIPHCVFTDVVVIQPSNTYNNTFYSIHTESGSSSEEEVTATKTHQSSSHIHHGINVGGSVKVVVQDLTPKGGTCLAWGGVHYKTFDGKVYTFQSPCQHTLLREAREHKYRVEMRQKDCKRQSYCPVELTVYLEEKAYVLKTGEEGSVIFRSSKRAIPIPASLPGIRVAMPGDYVQVNLDAAGVTIKWDTNNLVQIDGSILLWNNTEGLCGTLDGNPENDLMSKDGKVVQSISVLASSWQVNKIDDICEASPSVSAPCASEGAEDVTRATRFCTEMISMKKFRKCSKTMDVLQFLETCKWDYCACASTLNPQDCACRAIAVYAKECLRHGVEEMKNWRDADTCPMSCPDGKLYKSCGPDTQPSCAFPHTPAGDNSTCVEGCFCPEGLLLEGGKCVPKQECPCRLRNKSFQPGSVINKDCNTCTCTGGEWTCTAIACGARCRAVGDPHYSTFDGLRYDFMGRCTYTMMQAENVTVEVENVACSGSISEAMNLTPMKSEGKPSCTKAVTINYGGASVHLKQGGIVTVNGKEVTSIPVMAGDIRIRAASSLFLIVQLPNKVDLWWDGNTRVFIDVPPEFQGKTKGLCGTFNLNQKDDFLTPENDVEQSTAAFANKWRTREFCDDSNAPEPEHPCKANMENKEAAEKYCSKLKGNIFEACHWHVDVEPYYEACLYDMCACEGDISRCLCPTLGDYAMSCAKAGVMLQWRYNVQECELQCSGGQEYTVCADSCLRKCSDTWLAGENCSPRCVEGCACKQGELLDDNGVCVPVGLCPCSHKGLEFKAGYKEVRAGRRERELCTCVGARWDCVPASPEDVKNFPPAEDLRSNCSATANMEFTTCALAEPLTCKNMHLPPTPTSSECRPGCQCKRGFVLDTASKRCVQPAQCPCHHGGVSYPDGHKMQEECNECDCKRGNWTCTTKKCAGICSAWGDSHITTFDGSDYDFEGVCTYLLAKGNLDGKDGFDVEIQNVPCGTTGATCSKSVVMKVRGAGGEEVVSLTKDAPLPDVSDLKLIKLRTAGAYVFLDANLGATVQWDRQMRVYVKVDSMWQGRVRGLCGNYNGDQRDDFQTPSGGPAESSALIFADSWKLKPTCPKAQIVTDHCSQRPARKEWAATTCGALKRYPFTLCHTEVPPAPWVTWCERDACACDAGGDCECACSALAAYAYQCAHRGVIVKWRTQELCPMQCDEECSNYDGCISACPVETCDNTLYYNDVKGSCERDTCVEGCKPKKPCTNGTVYRNASSTECVPRAECKPPCMTTDAGVVVEEGGVVSEDACHTCRCSKHHVVCTGQPCSTENPSTIPTSPKPHDEPLKCVTGWTPWLNRGVPEAESNGESIEIEPLPKPNELSIGSPMCKREMMTDVECRTVTKHQSPKETGLNVECSLEKGLVCKEHGATCPDFEIRVHCRCDEPKYETAYVCDGKTLNISCAEGSVIRLIRANYGRFSITKCNDRGNTDWNVNCMSTKSLRVLHNRCNKHQNCSILASTTIFGDPCPNTQKYLEADYECVPGKEADPCLYITTPNTKHPTDCAKFYECSPSGPVLKDCAPGTLYNPAIFVCDWPAAVALVRPECAETTLAPSTTVPITLPTSGSSPISEWPSPVPPALTPPAEDRCPPGQEYKECAYPCDQLCDYFRRTLMEKGRCIREKCVEGCVAVNCEAGKYWRDSKTCVAKKDCTCLSDGKQIKPGGVVVDGCLKCQCLNNDFHCDTSDCVSVVQPPLGSTHQPYILPQITETIPPTTVTTLPPITTSTIPPSTILPTVTTYTIPPSTFAPTNTTAVPVSTVRPAVTRPPVTTSAPSTLVPIVTPEPTKEPRLLEETTKEPYRLETTIIVMTTITPIIVKSTATPPPECSPDDYLELMWGDEPLPDSSITASSVAGELFQPQFAVLDGHPLDITAGSWNPAPEDQNPYIQVELPRREPIYAVDMQGSPIFDQYVTSYEILYSDDGVTFHTVDGADGKPKVFRGPVDHRNSLRQTINPPIEAKFVRIHPITWHEEAAVRMELIGCRETVTTPTEKTAATVVTTLSPQCDEPLGLAAELPLDSITTSSNPEAREYLHLNGSRGWSPLYSTPGEWVMFNFTSPRNITGIKMQGGNLGWVTAYKVLYSTDLESFSPIVDKDKKERIFPANYDKTSVIEHEFRPPIRAQYLKVVPLKWKDNIEMKIEPIGCFEPYPATTPTPPTTKPTTPPPCQLCPDIQSPASGCACAGTLYYDGESCVPREQCPCVISFMSYPVGSTFRGDNCDECVCKIGGVTDCEPVKKCECNPGPSGKQQDLVPKLLPTTCECICTPCPEGTRLCRTSLQCVEAARWCDGVADCADDELDCATEPTVVTQHDVTVAATQAPTTLATTVKPLECPVVSCPPGYQVAFTTARPTSSWAAPDLPPPKPRYSYTRYIKGGYRKGGYAGAKGGFSKGGFSKGGFSGPPKPPQNNEAFTLDKPTAPVTPAPVKEECPQFRCIPKVPPFPRPGSTPAPVVCSVVSCPPGYTLKLETLSDGFNRCPQYECVPPPERPVFCNMTGRTFNTFDGAEYKYDVCFHILARDNRLNAWTVLVRKKCRDSGCWNELLVHQDDQLILVKPNLMIEYDNYEYTVEQTSKICFQKNSFDVARVGNGVLVKSRKYNFTVVYSNEGDVKIGVLKNQMGSVDGLCGAFDGDSSNDRRLPSGQVVTSIEQFGRAWAKPGLRPDACATRVVANEKQKRVWELCNVITKEPLSRCASVLNLDKWRSICLEKVCSCSDLVVNGTKRTEEQCRCLLLEQMVAECLAADKELDIDWRGVLDCPADCPAPLVHYDCYRKRCSPTCLASSSAGSPACPAVEGECFPGCYCPEGKLRKGDTCVAPADCLDCTCNGVGSPAKYVTFEGDELPFLGNCTYLASRDKNVTGQHKYQVYATNGPCEDNPSITCTKAIHLIYEKNVIHITKDQATKKLLTSIGNTPVYKYPVRKDWGSIILENGHDVVISLPDIHVEVIVLHPKLEFTIRLPSSLYSERTEGLCGICGGQLEYFLTSNGTATDDFDVYGKSWQASPEALTTLEVPPQEQCDAPPPPPECVPPPPASNPCYNLYNADKFGECRALVDPQPFVESCEADLCANATDLCATLERYAAECRKQGVCLEKWRQDLCPYPCESPLVYRSCVDCERTCDNKDELIANPEKCAKQPVEGCFCPEGKVRVNNTCIEPQKCFPCDAKKEHYAGDQWQENACTQCTCSKVPGERAAHVSCTTQSCTTPVCGANEDLLKETARPGDCCPTYVCVPKPKVKECVEPKKMECGFGQVLKQKTGADECPEFACECKPASECEDIPPESEVEMLEPGMQRLVDLSGCCPRATLVCRTDKCPRSPACPQFHDLNVRNISGKCCPEYECDKCLVKLEWESSPSGGEKARSIPEVTLKEIDAVWLDGPCRTCRCAISADGAAHAQCSETRCPSTPALAHVLTEPRAVPFACCPEIVQVACRDGDNVYKVGENWTSSDDVCTIYKCVQADETRLERVKTVQGCEKNCQPGWRYIPATPESKKCCGKCEPVACVIDGVEHPIGEKWTSTDFCTNYTCVNLDGTLQVQSSNESCPTVSDALRKQFVLKEEKVPGQCCSTQEPVACRVGNKIYQEGQSWPTPDPCRNVTCARDPTGRLTHTASVQSCVRDCKRGWVYAAPVEGACCGRCVQDQCVIGDEMKKPGTTWESADNCTSFSCERAGEEVFVTSSRPTCPDVSRCDPVYLVNETCCQICKEPAEALSKCVPQSIPSKQTVELVRARLGPHGLCVNKHPIKGFKECRGSCDSGALYDTALGMHENKCECCAATAYAPLEVVLSCEDGSEQPHQLASPSKCSCNACTASKNPWGTKSGYVGTKSSYRKPTPVQKEELKQEETDVIPDIFQRFGEE